MAEASSAAGEDVLDRLRRTRSSMSSRSHALVARAVRDRPSRARRRARAMELIPQDRAPLRRALRRRLGDPLVLPRRDGPAPRDCRPQRRRWRRELRRLHALRRQRGLGAAATHPARAAPGARGRRPARPRERHDRLAGPAACAAWRRRSRSTGPSATCAYMTHLNGAAARAALHRRVPRAGRALGRRGRHGAPVARVGRRLGRST